MALAPVQFAQHSYQARSGQVSSQRLVNLYAEANPHGSKGAITLYGTPGLKLWTTAGSGPIRGAQKMGGAIYVVSGTELYRVTSVGTATLLGTIPGAGPVQMAANLTQVAICANTAIYVATATTLTLVSDDTATDVTYLDGYGVFTRPDSEVFYISALDDFTSLNALDFSSVDGFTDNVVGLIADHRELWLFGEESTEIWYNTGDASFPFSRAGSGFVERGCKSSHSIAKDSNAIFWLGDDLRVYVAQGYQPQPISTPAIDKIIHDATSQSTAEGFVYTQAGHKFYSLSFPDCTISYNVTTGLWCERSSYGVNRWRAQSHVSAFGKQLVGDFQNGNLYELDLDTYTDNGDPIIREATSAPLHAAGNRATMARFFADFEPGVGITSGDGSDPQAALDWSDDGGKTWSNELWADIGPMGEYHRRTTWNRLGSFYTRHMRVKVSDPVKVAIAGAYAELEAME